MYFVKIFRKDFLTQDNSVDNTSFHVIAAL